MSGSRRSLVTLLEGASGVSRWSAIGSGLMMVAIMLVVCFEVVMRFFFNSPVSWATEVPELMLLTMVWCGVAYTAQIEGHVRLEFITSHLGKRARGLLAILTNFAAFVVTSTFVWQGASLLKSALQEGWHTSSLVPIIIWPWLVFLPLGALLMSLEWLSKCVTAWRELQQIDHRGVDA